MTELSVRGSPQGTEDVPLTKELEVRGPEGVRKQTANSAVSQIRGSLHSD